MAMKMSLSFRDPSSRIRIFVRHSHVHCAAGTASDRSLIFIWSTSPYKDRDDLDLLEFLVHEMVHNWARIDPSNGSLEDAWYNEGLAEYYSVVLPHRFGITTRETFVERMNLKLSAYYTNPAISMMNAEIVQRYWTDNHAGRMPYHRGFVYFVRVAGQLSAAARSSDLESASQYRDALDDIIANMIQRRLHGKPTDPRIFLALLCRTLDVETVKSDYNAMLNGTRIVPSANSLHAGYVLERHDQEQFYLGFNESSLTSRRVTGLNLESRAANDGGVRNGDVIVKDHFVFLWAVGAWTKNFTMTIQRIEAGQDVIRELTWWPRSRDKVPSWQWTREGMLNTGIKEDDILEEL